MLKRFGREVTNNTTLALSRAASPDLIHCAAFGRFVCPPAQQARPVPHALAGDVISADFDHEHGVQRHRHPLLARPAALAAGRPPREPSAPDSGSSRRPISAASSYLSGLGRRSSVAHPHHRTPAEVTRQRWRKLSVLSLAAEWWAWRKARPAANAARTGALLAKEGQRRATLTGINLGSSGTTSPERVRNSRGWTVSALSNAFPYQPSDSRTPSSGCPVGNPTPRHRPIIDSGSKPASASKQERAAAQSAGPSSQVSGHPFPAMGGLGKIIRPSRRAASCEDHVVLVPAIHRASTSASDRTRS